MRPHRHLHAALLLAVALVGGTARAEPAPPQVMAPGQGAVHVMPDRALLTIRVQTNASNAASAGSDCTRIAKAVTDALTAAGLTGAELRLTRLSVEPHWEYNGRRRRTGFDAVHTLRIETARLDRIGAWIDAALGAGATDIDDPTFRLDDPEAPRQEALAKAVAAARRDAETMARAAGGSLGELVVIGIGASGREGSQLDEIVVSAMRRTASAPVPTSIVPGELVISESVSARWAFLPTRH
jgi:uncharacterized protein YggE